MSTRFLIPYELPSNLMLIGGPLNLAPSTIDFRVSSGVGALIDRIGNDASANRAMDVLAPQFRRRHPHVFGDHTLGASPLNASTWDNSVVSHRRLELAQLAMGVANPLDRCCTDQPSPAPQHRRCGQYLNRKDCVLSNSVLILPSKGPKLCRV